LSDCAISTFIAKDLLRQQDSTAISASLSLYSRGCKE
jgi:hypothetical protein